MSGGSERNVQAMKTLRAVGSGDAAPLGLENSLKMMEDLTSTAEVEVNAVKSGEEEQLKERMSSLSCKDDDDANAKDGHSVVEPGEGELLQEVIRPGPRRPQAGNEYLEAAMQMESGADSTVEVEQRQMESNINTSAQVEERQTEPENSRTESHEDEESSSGSSSSDSEDELGREQRVSAEKIVSESESFMDRLRQARAEIDDLGLVSEEEKLNPGDVQPSKTVESVQDLEILTLKSPPLQSSTSSEICSDQQTPSSRPSEPSSSDYKPPNKVAELNTWVEKGIWMSSSEADKGNDQRRSRSNSDVLQISPVSTLSRGAYLLELPGTETATATTSLEVNDCSTKVDKSPTDTEVYMAGPPPEFRNHETDDTDEDYKQRMDDMRETSSGSFISCSQNDMFPPGGATEKDKTNYATCPSGDGDTDCSEQFVSPRTDTTTTECDDPPPYPGLPRKELMGKVEKISFGEEYDGVQVASDDEQTVEADLLWANAKYWENGQMIVPEDETENDSGQGNSPVHGHMVHHTVACASRLLEDSIPTPRSGRAQEDYEIHDSAGDYTCDEHSSRIPVSDEMDRARALTDSNRPNSATESTYDHTYLGRTHIFRPTLTAQERKMLGVPSETSSGDQEVEMPVLVDAEPKDKKIEVKGAMKELLFPALKGAAPRGEDKKTPIYAKVLAAFGKKGSTSTTSKVQDTNVENSNRHSSLPNSYRHRRSLRAGHDTDSRTDSEREESPGSSIVQVQYHGSENVQSSGSDAEGSHMPNLISEEVPMSPLVRSRCVVADDDSDFENMPHTSRKYNSLPRRADVRENQSQSHPLGFDTTPDSHAEPHEPGSGDSADRSLAEKVHTFYDSKKNLKKEMNLKIRVLKKDTKVRRSTIKYMTNADMQELAENRKNQIDQIEREAKFKAFKAKQDYKVNKNTMQQDKWKGSVRKLIEKRKLEKRKMEIKLESKLLSLADRTKKEEQELLSKADKKSRKAEKQFEKKLCTLDDKMRKSYFMGENGGYVPDDDLFMESLDEICESVLMGDADPNFLEKVVGLDESS